MANPLRMAKEKSCGVEVARTGDIHYPGNSNGGNGQDFISVGHDAAQGRACNNGHFTVLAERLQGTIKVLRAVERLDFGFVGKDNINVIPDELEKAFTMALDAK